MAKTEEGGFELVLGNRQLVSVFLIVVILLGIFFSMGYLVGKSSSTIVVADSGKTSAGKSIPTDNSNPATSPQADSSEPAVDTQLDATPASHESSKPSPTHAEERSTATPKKPNVAEAERAVAVGEPAAGQYLQVVATSRADAEIVAESLSKKGFRTVVAAVPGSALNRVLVGPVKDSGEMADTRGRLEGAGFKPYVRRY